MINLQEEFQKRKDKFEKTYPPSNAMPSASDMKEPQARRVKFVDSDKKPAHEEKVAATSLKRSNFVALPPPPPDSGKKAVGQQAKLVKEVLTSDAPVLATDAAGSSSWSNIKRTLAARDVSVTSADETSAPRGASDTCTTLTASDSSTMDAGAGAGTGFGHGAGDWRPKSTSPSIVASKSIPDAYHRLYNTSSQYVYQSRVHEEITTTTTTTTHTTTTTKRSVKASLVRNDPSNRLV